MKNAESGRSLQRPRRGCPITWKDHRPDSLSVGPARDPVANQPMVCACPSLNPSAIIVSLLWIIVLNQL